MTPKPTSMGESGDPYMSGAFAYHEKQLATQRPASSPPSTSTRSVRGDTSTPPAEPPTQRERTFTARNAGLNPTVLGQKSAEELAALRAQFSRHPVTSATPAVNKANAVYQSIRPLRDLSQYGSIELLQQRSQPPAVYGSITQLSPKLPPVPNDVLKVYGTLSTVKSSIAAEARPLQTAAPATAQPKLNTKRPHGHPHIAKTVEEQLRAGLENMERRIKKEETFIQTALVYREQVQNRLQSAGNNPSIRLSEPTYNRYNVARITFAIAQTRFTIARKQLNQASITIGLKQIDVMRARDKYVKAQAKLKQRTNLPRGSTDYLQAVKDVKDAKQALGKAESAVEDAANRSKEVSSQYARTLADYREAVSVFDREVLSTLESFQKLCREQEQRLQKMNKMKISSDPDEREKQVALAKEAKNEALTTVGFVMKLSPKSFSKNYKEQLQLLTKQAAVLERLVNNN